MTTPNLSNPSTQQNSSSYNYHFFTTPRNLTYAYIHIAPSPPSTDHTNNSTPAPKPYILFIHGFPSQPLDFHHQITHLSSQGYGIIAPSLLGYHPSSAPLDANLYRLKLLSSDIISILDHLAISSPVHALGHDWGCHILSRLEYYYPQRLSKLTYLTIAPPPMGTASRFNLDMVNAMTEQKLGYTAFGYMKFFTDDPERAARLLAEKQERMDMLMFAENAGLWREYFGKIGGLETWLLQEDEKVEMVQAMTVRDLEIRKGVLGFHGDGESRVSGYAGPLRYYLTLTRNLNVEDEQTDGYQTHKRVLQVVCEKDPIAFPQMHIERAKAYVKDSDRNLRIESLYSGHFVMYEQHEKLNRILEDFFA